VLSKKRYEGGEKNGWSTFKAENRESQKEVTCQKTVIARRREKGKESRGVGGTGLNLGAEGGGKKALKSLPLGQESSSAVTRKKNKKMRARRDQAFLRRDGKALPKNASSLGLGLLGEVS